ncbi:MAG: TadE/TadG family type IV pilus assembly protein [Dehalococcoidia bacterium]
MTKLFRRFWRRGEKGQSLVEFTFLVPIFLILVFAIVDFGMGFHAWISITNGAREGARLGAVLATEQEIEDRVYEAVTLPDEGSNMVVSVTNAQGQPGESVVVEVDYDYELITPLAGLVQFLTGDAIGQTLNLNSTADMRLE